MNTIHVPVRDAYNVFIERGILSKCGALIEDLISGSTCAIITDDNVDKLYADTLIASLTEAGLKAVKFVIPHGEASKCNASLMQIYSFLCENDITRADCLHPLPEPHPMLSKPTGSQEVPAAHGHSLPERRYR